MKHWQSSCAGQAEGWAREIREQGSLGIKRSRGWLERGFVQAIEGTVRAALMMKVNVRVLRRTDLPSGNRVR